MEQTLAEVGVETIPAKGGFYNYPIMNHIKEKLKAKKGITDSKTLGNTILDECGVAMLSSVEFGRDPEELGFRLSYVDFDGENALKMA